MAAVILGRMIRTASSASLETRASREALLDMIRLLSDLRNGDHRTARLKIELRRWEEEKAGIEKAAERRELWKPLDFLMMVQSHEACVKALAAGLTPEKEDALRSFLKMAPRQDRANAAVPASSAHIPSSDPTESNRIRPDPTAIEKTAKQSKAAMGFRFSESVTERNRRMNGKASGYSPQ